MTRESAEPLMHSGEFAEQAPDDDQYERREQDVYPPRLRARLGATDDRREEQSAGYIGCGDPEDRELQMPGAQNLAGQNRREIKSVEAARVGAVVRRAAADQGLRKEQQRNHREVLDRRALTRRRDPGEHLDSRQ